MKSVTFLLLSTLSITLGLLDGMTNGDGSVDTEAMTDHIMRLEEKVQDLTSKYDSVLQSLAKGGGSHGSGGSTHSQANEILFQVRAQDDMNNVTDDDVMVFDDVIYNTGSGYSVNTGVFTAPAAGTYLFWSYVVLNDNEDIEIELTKNGVAAAFGSAPHHRVGRVASLTSALQLKKGDRVWMTKTGSEFLKGSGLSSFGGVLLYAH